MTTGTEAHAGAIRSLDSSILEVVVAAAASVRLYVAVLPCEAAVFTVTALTAVAAVTAPYRVKAHDSSGKQFGCDASRVTARQHPSAADSGGTPITGVAGRHHSPVHDAP